MTDTPWAVEGATEFRDWRLQSRRDHDRLITLNVRAYHGWILRRHDGLLEREHCGHAHTKPATARRCAEAWAKRRNRTEER